MLRELNQKIKIHNINDVTVVHEKLEENSFNDKSFDIVTSNSVLHHVDSSYLFWDELIRLVKATGIIFVMDLYGLRTNLH